MSLFEWFITGGAIAGYGAFASFGFLLFAWWMEGAKRMQAPTPKPRCERTHCLLPINHDGRHVMRASDIGRDR